MGYSHKCRRCIQRLKRIHLIGSSYSSQTRSDLVFGQFFFYYSFSFHEYICGIQYVFIFVPQQRCSSSLVILILGVVAFIDLTGKKCASPITDFLLKGGVHSYTLYPQHFPIQCDILDRDVEPLPQGRHPKKIDFFQEIVLNSGHPPPTPTVQDSHSGNSGNIDRKSSLKSAYFHIFTSLGLLTPTHPQFRTFS